jgi:hypothetical protein
VLAEAHGSFAKDASAAKIANAAKAKYVKQVKPFVAKPSPFGKVIHGYFDCIRREADGSGELPGRIGDADLEATKTNSIAR